MRTFLLMRTFFAHAHCTPATPASLYDSTVIWSGCSNFKLTDLLITRRFFKLSTGYVPTMAEGVIVTKKSLAELRREITCPICQENYTDPKLLPCNHYFCKECILQLVRWAGAGKSISCPKCRKEILLPKESLEKLETAFFINSIQESIASLERAQCAAKAEDSLAKNCRVHEEPLIVYCFDCGNLICSHCMVKDHNGHKLELHKVAAPDARKKLMEKLGPLRELKVSLTHAMVEVQTTRCELEAQGLSVANNIHTSFLELQKILDDRKRDLIKEAAKRVQDKMDRLLLQEESLSLASAEVQRVLDHIEQCVSHHDDSEFMGIHAELACQIQRGIEEHNEREVSLEPVEEVDVGVEVRCAEALQQLCQTKTKLTQLSIAPAKCTVSGEGAKAAVLNTISDVSLTTTKLNCKVDCHLNPLSNGFIIKCSVDQYTPRNYSIQYTPTVRGRCELTVSVDGQQVVDSPFPVFVSVPVAQLGRPVSVWHGVSRPTGVTVNSVGEVVVSERVGDVILFDKEGKKLISVKHKLGCCHGVAVDGEDNIYCIDFHSNKVMRCNRNGGRVKVHKVKQVQGPGHLCVAIVRDEVMVCECCNKGTIMVYDREWKYVRQIAVRSMGLLFDLSPDCHGNLYVTDWDSSVISVCNINGDLLRSFSCDENGVNKLISPRGVCVAGQYVYVTDESLHNVSVFTTGGAYMTSFGRHGSEEGCLNYPCALCIDRDGFVYVVDFGNDRVQVF